MLKYGTIDPSDVTPTRINFNPAFNRGGVPLPFGEDPIRAHPSPTVRKSFERDGIVNPVFLWARFDRVWVRYGGCRVYYAQQNKMKRLRAIVADFDDRFPDWQSVSKEEAMALFVPPPVGMVPDRFVDLPDGGIDLETTVWHEAVKYGT